MSTWEIFSIVFSAVSLLAYIGIAAWVSAVDKEDAKRRRDRDIPWIRDNR